MKTFLKKLKKFEKSLEKKIEKKGVTITVSGLTSSGKTTGAKAIAQAFRLKYYCMGEIFRKIAKRKKISLEELSRTRKERIDLEVDKKSLELAMKGNVVLDGRLSGWVAGRWAEVRIFYDTPLKVRARRFAKREGLSLKESLRRVKERDEADRDQYLKVYGIDINDLSIYHIIIDNTKFSLEDAKRKPVEIIRRFFIKK